MSEVTPIFLLSLPRSGSTLLQRLLGAQRGVATASEPWVLLPLVYTLRDRGVVAEYDHGSLRRGVDDFCRELPAGEHTYRMELRTLALSLYAQASPPDATFFLDKTPRYHLIVEELFGMFPEARFVFLWRNPLGVVASTVETWARGRWSVHRWGIDLYEGLTNLVDARRRHGDMASSVRYEDLVTDPEVELQRICEYIGVPFDPDVLSGLDNRLLRGRLGDQTGAERYGEVSQEPLDKWKHVLANPLRKAWCRRYLDWIGAERLEAMGYDRLDILEELNEVPVSWRSMVSDALRMSRGEVIARRQRALFDRAVRRPGMNPVR